MKIVKVIFSSEAEEVYNDLNAKARESKVDNMILNALNKKIELIKMNTHYGEPIAKDRIPQEYKNKYGVTPISC